MAAERIEAESKSETSGYEKERQDERRARLAGKVAKVTIGGVSETEAQIRHGLALDALLALRQSMLGGSVQGASTAYIRCARAITTDTRSADLDPDGVAAVVAALQMPLAAIVAGAGGSLDAVLKELDSHDDAVYDASSGRVVNEMNGPVDPLNTVVNLISYAAEAAARIVRTRAWAQSTELKENEAATG